MAFDNAGRQPFGNFSAPRDLAVRRAVLREGGRAENLPGRTVARSAAPCTLRARFVRETSVLEREVRRPTRTVLRNERSAMIELGGLVGLGWGAEPYTVSYMTIQEPDHRKVLANSSAVNSAGTPETNRAPECAGGLRRDRP